MFCRHDLRKETCFTATKHKLAKSCMQFQKSESVKIKFLFIEEIKNSKIVALYCAAHGLHVGILQFYC